MVDPKRGFVGPKPPKRLAPSLEKRWRAASIDATKPGMAEDFTNLSELEALMSEDGGAAIIDFWSPSCGPCKAMAPAFEALSDELSEEPIRFIRINTAAQPKLAQPFRIHSVPTLLFVHNGEILDVRVGALPGPALKKKAQWLLRKSRGEGFFSRIFGA